VQDGEGPRGEPADRWLVVAADRRLQQKCSVESNMGANLEPLSMVSMHASTANHSGQEFPTSAHRTGRAGFPHPALGRVSHRSRPRRPQMPAPAVAPQLPEDPLRGIAPRPARRDLVSSPQDVPHPLRDRLIHRPVRHPPRPVRSATGAFSHRFSSRSHFRSLIQQARAGIKAACGIVSKYGDPSASPTCVCPAHCARWAVSTACRAVRPGRSP
jgi:hypothetical protein